MTLSDRAERPYVRVTPEMEMTVVAFKALHPLDSYADIGEALGMSPRAVQYILGDLPKLRRNHNEEKANASLKERIVWVLDAVPRVDNVVELRSILGRADDAHSIVHILHSLHKEGKVDFIEKGAQKEPTRIALTARGRGLALPKKTNGIAPDAPDFVQERIPEQVESESEATADAPNDVNASAPGPEAEAYPFLDALLERESERLDRDAKAMAYIAAAEALEKVDPEMAAKMAAKANDFNASYPSPLEEEYLRFAANHVPMEQC